MHLAFPFRIDELGSAAEATRAEHVEQMIEQVLFTRPGERVNLPDFGCGVQYFVFGPTSLEMETALRARIEASLQRWLNGLIQLETIELSQVDSTVTIQVIYTLLPTMERRKRVFRL